MNDEQRARIESIELVGVLKRMVEEGFCDLFEQEDEFPNKVLRPSAGDLLTIVETAADQMRHLKRRRGKFSEDELAKEIASIAVTTKILLDLWLHRSEGFFEDVPEMLS